MQEKRSWRWGEGGIGVLFIIYIDRKTGRKTKELKSWMSNTSFSMKNGLKE